MEDMKNITFKKVDIHLKKADYEKLGEESGNFRVRIHDSIRQERILDDGFRLEWNRKVTLEPESLYRILVVLKSNVSTTIKPKHSFPNKKWT